VTELVSFKVEVAFAAKGVDEESVHKKRRESGDMRQRKEKERE
jgi:hypothetical protein